MSRGPVIVTGATGLVGRAVAERLESDGLPVVGISRSAIGRTRYESVEMDLEIRSVGDFRRRKPAAVVHCAARVPGPHQPDNGTNADATRQIDVEVVKACAEMGCRLIYVSSCILYDGAESSAKSERTIVRATTPYAEAKLQGELGALALPGSLVMRLPSPVGVGMRRDTVLPLFVARTLRGEPIEVWGTGTREQDFINVADIAEFVVLALRAGIGGTFNVASGRAVTTQRLAETIVKVVGRGSVLFDNRPDPLDRATARYRIDKARRQVGWSPRVDLESTVRRLAASLSPHL